MVVKGTLGLRLLHFLAIVLRLSSLFGNVNVPHEEGNML